MTGSGDAHDQADHDPATFLAQIPLFAALPAGARDHLAASATWRHVPAGAVVFHAGDPGDSLAVVWSGRLEAQHAHGGGTRVVATLGRGAWVGELSLLTGRPRAATVRARRDSELLVITARSFQALLSRQPELVLDVARLLAGELQSRPAATQPASPPTTFAVVPLASRLPTARFVDELVRALQPWGPVAVVDRPPGPAPAPGRWAALADRAERSHALVVLAATDPTGSPDWAAFCVRSADRVVALTHQETPPPWAVQLLAPHRPDLSVLSDAPRADALAPLLEALRPRAVHHLRPGAGFADASARVARRLSGHALGVVLSGGGARGMAHLGVLARLREAGVPVDRIGGCSAGALVSALWALGLTDEELVATCRHELVAHRPFADFTVPRDGLIRGRRARSMLERLFGDARVEELATPWFSVSADLVSGELVVHRRGPVWLAVGASMAIPGYAPPVPLGTRLLVDGGLLDNFPVDVMAGDGEGPVIGVDVMRDGPVARTPRTRRRRAPATAEPAGPGIVAVLGRSLALGGRARADQNRRRADVVITPEVGHIALFDFDRLDDAVAAGRRAADQALDAGLP
ncbi:MAG: patatin-like phospholipase family protein [Acidimicrobiales bacterium]|nr:patatin-like phospholipase family protein [Acidimicrobiales bacterium]